MDYEEEKEEGERCQLKKSFFKEKLLFEQA